jgi:DNA-3-methyladenine glycosylase II
MRKAIKHLKNADPVLAAIIQQVGPYGIKFLDPDFETLVKSIVSQQLSGKVARTIYGRLIEAAGGKLTPESLLKLRPTRLRALGLSRQKIEYIRDLARHARAGSVDFGRLPDSSDDEVIEHLTAVKGIGVWTAHMFLIFALRRPNVLPTGDLGIRSAIRKAYGLEELPKPAAIEELARAWHPYCSVASWYLWRSLETKAQL